jgi:hypothetical protein
MKDVRSNAKFSIEMAPDNTISIESPVESLDQTLEKDDNEVPGGTRDKGLQNLLVMISLCTLWMIFLPLL